MDVFKLNLLLLFHTGFIAATQLGVNHLQYPTTSLYRTPNRTWSEIWGAGSTNLDRFFSFLAKIASGSASALKLIKLII